MTAVPLPDAQAVWTVFGPSEKEGEAENMEEEGNSDEEDGAKMHAYMVISQGNDKGTIVLKGRELEEFDEDEQVDFEFDAKTVCVGNIFSNQRIVQADFLLLLLSLPPPPPPPASTYQVTPWNVYVLNGPRKEQELPVVAGNGLQIVAAYICDPYIALILQVTDERRADMDGRLNLLVGDASSMQVNYVSHEIHEITAACFFLDPVPNGEPFQDAQSRDVMLAAAPRNGHMQLYTLPSLELVYDAADFVLAPSLLIDEGSGSVALEPADLPNVPFILDMCIEPIPFPHKKESDTDILCLVAITSSADILLYKSFECCETHRAAAAEAEKHEETMEKTVNKWKKLRFKKVNHEIMLRGEDVFDDFFVDELELEDVTRETTLKVFLLLLPPSLPFLPSVRPSVPPCPEPILPTASHVTCRHCEPPA
eukprot:762781-Hanusia_phi.AAC.4